MVVNILAKTFSSKDEALKCCDESNKELGYDSFDFYWEGPGTYIADSDEGQYTFVLKETYLTNLRQELISLRHQVSYVQEEIALIEKLP